MNNNEKFLKNILFLLLVMTPIGQISIDIYSISLPTIALNLGASDSMVRLTITAFLFSYGIGQVIYGALSDFYGRKMVLKYTFPFYILSTFLIPFTPSIYLIIILRFIQGISISAVSVVTKSIAVDVYTNSSQLTKTITYMTMIWGMSPVIAPLIGGYIHIYLGWRWSFYILGITTSLIYFYMLISLPETNKLYKKLSIKNFYTSYFDILKDLHFWKNMFYIILACTSLISFTTQTPYIIQDYFNLTPIQNGYISLFVSIFFMIGTKLSDSLNKLNFNYFINISISLTIFISIYMLTMISFFTFSVFYFLILSSFLMFIVGIIFPYSMTKCLQLFPKSSGSVSALIGLISLCSTASLISILSILHINNLLSFPIIILLLNIGVWVSVKIISIKSISLLEKIN